MRRPRNPLPYGLHDLRNAAAPGLYEKSEAGITYTMPLEVTRHLKNWWRYFHMGTEEGTEKHPSMARWYRDLPAAMKKQVQRSGAPPEPDDFHPDPSWGD